MNLDNPLKEMCYYTDNRCVSPIFEKVQELLTYSSNVHNIPITCTSLKPTDFGHRRKEFPHRERSYPTMVLQIMTALAMAKGKYVFFTENDVLYHHSHFEFTPPRDDVFYYNNNVFRWKLWDFKLVTYDNMRPLSCLCCNREFALEHYKMRWRKIHEWGLDHFRSREPRQGRIWGYEPGTKKRRRGGLTDDVCELWSSEKPNIDIRHRRTFTSIKCDLKDFKNKPDNWQEIRYNEIPGWDLLKLFPEGMKDNCDLDFNKLKD